MLVLHVKRKVKHTKSLLKPCMFADGKPVITNDFLDLFKTLCKPDRVLKRTTLWKFPNFVKKASRAWYYSLLIFIRVIEGAYVRPKKTDGKVET